MVQFAAQCYFSSHKSSSVSFYSYICCVNLQVAVSVAKIFNKGNVVYLNLFSPVRLTVAFLLQLVKDPQVFFGKNIAYLSSRPSKYATQCVNKAWYQLTLHVRLLTSNFKAH